MRLTVLGLERCPPFVILTIDHAVRARALFGLGPIHALARRAMMIEVGAAHAAAEKLARPGDDDWAAEVRALDEDELAQVMAILRRAQYARPLPEPP